MISNLQVSSHRVSAHVTTAVSHMLSPTHDFSGSSGGGAVRRRAVVERDPSRGEDARDPAD